MSEVRLARRYFRQRVSALAALTALAALAGSVGGCSSDSQSDEVSLGSSAITFNGQSRTEYLGATTEHQHWANSVGILVGVQGLPAKGCDTLCQVSTEASNYCPGALQGQRTFASPNGDPCTAFMIGADLFATAGHCMQPDNAGFPDKVCSNFGVVMRWRGQTGTYGSNSNTTLDEIHILRCKKLVAHGGLRLVHPPTDPLMTIKDGPVSSDWAVFQVDRPVRQFTGSGPRIPLPLDFGLPAVGAGIALIGHPDALPIKIDADGSVLAVLDNDVLSVAADARPGSSGSPVVNRASGLVESIFTTPPSERSDDFIIDDEANDCIDEFDCNAGLCTGGEGVTARLVTSDPAVRARLSTRQLPDADGDGIPESVTVHTAAGYVTVVAKFTGALGTVEVPLTNVPVDPATDALPILLAVQDQRLVVAAGTLAISFAVSAAGLSEVLRFPLQSAAYDYITTPTATTLVAVTADGRSEVYSLTDGSFGGTGAGSASEYVMILLDQTGSMTATGTAPNLSRWDDAVNAASTWVQFDSLSAPIVNRAYSIWTFKHDSTQSGAVRVWPTQGSANCATFEDSTGYCVLGSNAAAYSGLLTQLESIRETHRAVVGPNTPLARSLCEALESLRSRQAFKRIILESDGGENATALTHACGGVASAPFDGWNTSIADWSMTVDSWQAKVVRRATRLNQLIDLAVQGALSSSDFFPVDFAWHVDLHFALTNPLLATSASRAALVQPASSNALEYVDTTSGSPSASSSSTLAALAALVPNASIDPAEYSLFAGLGAATPRSTVATYVSATEVVYGIPHPVPGDVDNSGCTDQADLSIIAQSDVWMHRAVQPNDLAIRADLTRDGWVNLQDTRVVLDNWAAGCPNAPQRPVPQNCSDDVWNGDETDIDCGGSCSRCPEGFTCQDHDDCATSRCLDRFCRAAEPLDFCACNQSKCSDCTGPITSCLATPGCSLLVQCTMESQTCRFPHENCSGGRSCHQIVGYDQSSPAGQAANNVIACMGGC